MRYLVCILLLSMVIIGCDRDDDNNSGPGVPTGITVRSQDVYDSGVRLVYGEISYPESLSVDSAGPDRIWQFSDHAWSDSFSLTYCDPASRPFGQSFPTATRAVAAEFRDWEDVWQINWFERVDNHGIWDLGVADEDQCEIFDEASCRLMLPALYGTTWSEVEYDTSGDYSYYWVYIDSTIWTADAWGKIITPYETCNVLRGLEEFVEYEKGPYDSVFHPAYYDLAYYWIDQHGDIVAWASPSGYMGPDPYFDYAYINLRLSSEQVAAPAGFGSSGHVREQSLDGTQRPPRPSKNFAQQQFRH